MSADATPQTGGTPESEKKKARAWFDRARTVAESRNYEYAIEAYISGLRIWPDAVEEGHKMLRAVSVQRKSAGGKPLGFLESRKHSTAGKDPHLNMFEAELLWAHDPENVQHMEAMVVNAGKAGPGHAAGGVWMAQLVADRMMQEKKVSAARYGTLCTALDALGEAAAKSGQFQAGLDAYQSMVKLALMWKQQYPVSQEASKAANDAQSKMAIVKGRFDTADSFRESMKDREKQAEIHDRDRVVTADSRLDELIKSAQTAFEDDPESQQKLNPYVDLLTRRERDAEENLAVKLLTEAYERTKSYSFKSRADDIRMKQLGRAGRKIAARLQANRDDPQVRSLAREQRDKQLELEISVYEERTREYPTDLRVRFGLAERYFKAKRHDDAVPLFQQAQADGRHRDASRSYIGRCFFEKALYSEAVGVLRQALEGYEMGARDETGKDLMYWLARSLEAADDRDEAIKAYGQLIQADYNFRDARARLEALRKSGNEAGATKDDGVHLDSRGNPV